MRRKDTLVGCPMADGIRQLSDPSLPWPSDEQILADLEGGGSEAALAILLGRMRLLGQDHGPDDWPAVQMRDITALCDAAMRRQQDYLQGWNDCHAHMAEEVVRLDDRIEKLREGILAARREGCACDFHLFGQDEDLLTDDALDHYQTLEQQRNAAADDAAGALDLVSRIREALGDHGLRMQDELLEYCRELAARAVPHA